MAKLTKRDKERQEFLGKAILAYVQEKNIPDEYRGMFIQKVEAAIAAAAKKECGVSKNAPKEVITCVISPDTYAVQIFHNKTVVEEVISKDTDILLADATRYNRKAKLGDIISIPVSIDVLGRNAAQTVKHTLRQGVKEIELQQLKAKIGEMVDAIVVKKYDNGDIDLKAYNQEIHLPVGEQFPGEQFDINSIVKIYITDIREVEGDTRKGTKSKKTKIFVSRKSDQLIRRVFEKEVTEIASGIVEIKGIERDNGVRVKKDENEEAAADIKDIAKDSGARIKVAVYSKNPDIDPVGACVGQGGSRIEAIKKQLGDNLIDVIKYSDDPKEYIANALAPAEVLHVHINDEEAKSCDVTVPEDKLSLAIGNSGQNVRLAAKLTKWHINITTSIPL